MVPPASTHGSSPALLLDPPKDSSSVAVTSVTVHPLVLLSVLDHHTRRAEGAGRVIGTLLGRRDGQRVEVTNCFAVPHAERGDEVAIGKDFNRQMLGLHGRADGREVVVGWYGTALPDEDGSAGGRHRCIADTSSLIHEFYAGECDDEPVHLVADAALAADAVPLRAYRAGPAGGRGAPLATAFHELRLGLTASAAEKVGVDRMIGAAAAPGGAPAQQDEGKALRTAVGELLARLETCSAYVDEVVAGTVPADDAVGREIAATLSAVPRIRPEVFDRMFNDSLQDMLMVTYLSNITKTQLTIAEKLNEALGK